MSRSQKILKLALAVDKDDNNGALVKEDTSTRPERKLSDDLDNSVLPFYSFDFPEFTIEDNVVIETIPIQTLPSNKVIERPVELDEDVLLSSLVDTQPTFVSREDYPALLVNDCNDQQGPIIKTAEENVPVIFKIAKNNMIGSIVPYSDSESDEFELERPVVKRKKRCQVKANEWESNKNQRQREQGLEYCGKKKIDGKWSKDIKKQPKKIKPRCKCTNGKKSVLKCHIITENDRKEIFGKFWSMTWQEKKVYIEGLVKVIPTSRKRDRKDPQVSKRSSTFIYQLRKGEDLIKVCKTLFINTICIGKSSVWSWKQPIHSLKQAEQKAKSIKEDVANEKTKPFAKDNKELNDFIDGIPKMESHYCRQRTSKLYLQPDIRSKKEFYTLYVEYCKSKNMSPLSVATFSNTLTVKNVSLFKPKKDLCETCNGFKLGHISEQVYNLHIEKKNEARTEKDNDKKNQDYVFTADLQAVLLAPRSNVSSGYYKTKLCVHNWCIYDLKTQQGHCFIWNESEGGLNAEEFATILSKFLQDKVIPVIRSAGDNNPSIVLFTDGCTYQNRNVVMSNALLNVAMINNVTIVQKYLEVGHTQMEVDSMHAMIEKRLKNQTIHVPAEYIHICENAKKTSPYDVKYLNYSYFKTFQSVQFYKSIRPGKMKGDAKVRFLCHNYITNPN